MAAKGSVLSIIYKILIVVFIFLLWQVISIPGKIWSEEEQLRETSRNNMNAIYEAEMYYFGKNNSFVPADSLEKLVTFIESDSALNEKQKIGRLTHVLLDSINNILQVPTIQAIVPISRSLSEINGDLEFNSRYFEKYDNLITQKEEIKGDLREFRSSENFPSFVKLKTYVDSLNILKDRLNDYQLQNSAQLAQRFVDSIVVYLPRINLAAVNDYWRMEYQQINSFVQDIKKTDVVLVTTVHDRLKKFIDRINKSMTELEAINIQSDIRDLEEYKNGVSIVYEQFLAPENFLTTQKNAILQLDEVDSTLVKFDESDFFDPDTFDGQARYLVAFKEEGSQLTVESPNLLGIFQENLIEASEPLRNLSVYPYFDKLTAGLDSTLLVMNKTKEEYRLNRYSTELLLSIKELDVEMKNYDSIKLLRYANRVKQFADTVQQEKRISALRPMIENLLNPLDTLAQHIEERDVTDLKEKMDYFGSKFQRLDSLIANNDRIPARVKRNIDPFYSTFENVYDVVEEIKSGFKPEEGEQLRQAGETIEQAMLRVLNGIEEPIYTVFAKKHENHGYIENGQKSWELAE